MRRSLGLTWIPALVLALLASASIAPGQAYEALHEFDGSDGQLPREGLITGADTDFYGITDSGGANGFGVFFKITGAGGYTDLYDFDQNEVGYTPVVLVRGCDDNFYGLTAAAFEPPGTFHAGTFIQLTPGGSVTALHTFPGDGTEGSPGNTSSLVRATDCNFYGTTTSGGAGNNGKIFQLTAAGDYTGLRDFPDLTGPDGSYPQGLIEGGDGAFYGATGFGGDPVDQRGTLFRVTSGGELSTLHAFKQAEGGATPTWITRALNGHFFGTSATGGATAGGTLFRFTTAPGDFELLHTFSGPDGTAPSGPLIEASDGNFYGTAQFTSGFCCGTIYQRTPGGNLSRVYAFETASGANPMSGVTEWSFGGLFGTAFSGGSTGLNAGVVFKHAMPPSVRSLDPGSGPAAGGTLKTIEGTTFADGATVDIGGVPATGVTWVDSTHLTATSPALAPGTLNDVKVTNPNTSYSTLKKGWFADFLDVPQADLFHFHVEYVFRAGITAGCGGGNYCRNDIVKRKQMAVFLLKAKFGASHVPPPATGTVFNDVPASDPFAPWIEELAGLSITGGCGGGNYCPEDSVRRDQMAVFLLKAYWGSAYTPPACAGLFQDVACPGAFAVDWIEGLYNQGVTGGCVLSPLQYCPLSSVLRGQMAVFLFRNFFGRV